MIESRRNAALFIAERGEDMSDIKNRLKEKIDSCYSEYKNKWLVMSPEALIENADEISVVNKVHMLLVGAISDTDAEYLIRFKNP